MIRLLEFNEATESWYVLRIVSFSEALVLLAEWRDVEVTDTSGRSEKQWRLMRIDGTLCVEVTL